MSEDKGVRVMREAGVGRVVLDRPERRNALDLSMRAAIRDAFEQLTDDADVRVIVVTGGDRVFAAGADLNMLVACDAPGVNALELGRYWRPVAQCPKPVIAAVSGLALGAGCELAMMCDIIVADADTRFGQPECRVGIMPGAGGTQRLLRAVGRPVASFMLMTGEMLDGERAWQLGLASVLAEPGQVQARATEIAARIAAMPPLALAAIKRVLGSGGDLPLEHALSLEQREFSLLFDSADQHEGMQAFLDRRTPVFTGR